MEFIPQLLQHSLLGPPNNCWADFITEVDKYHSGTFYSTYVFVSYFLIRQRPFSEISLEI